MIVDDLYKQIEAGRQGLNKGLSSGLPKLDSLTYGIIRENITLIGASSGAGKSSLASYIALYNAYKEYLNSGKTKQIWWLVFSFEMSGPSLFARLLSMHLWDEYQLVVPHKLIFSLDAHLSDEVYEKIEASKEWLKELDSRCIIIDKPVTAKGLYSRCKTFAEKHGKFIVKSQGVHNGESWESHDYISDDPQQYLITIVDHVKLFDTQPGHTSKQEIDEACKYMIYFRDKCKFTFYIVQQLNRGFQDMSRRTEAGGAFADIQLNDFSDTGDTVNASNTVLAIFFPFREKMTKWKDYIVDPKRGGLGDRLRTISLLKNRDGNADKFVGVGFYGEAHQWVELPKSDQITDYSIYQHL